MRRLIHFELRKILKNRITVIALLGAFLLNILFFVLNVVTEVHYSLQIRSLHGLQAIEYDKQIMGKFRGALTTDYINKINAERETIEKDPNNLEVNKEVTELKIQEMKKDGYTEAEIAKMPPVMKLKDDVYVREIDQYDMIQSHMSQQERMHQIIEELKDGNIKGIYERKSKFHTVASVPDTTNAELEKLLSMYEQVSLPYYYDFYGGWNALTTGFPLAVAIILGSVIVISLSPVFSQEYSQHTDAIILTTRHGKKQLIVAKLLSAFLFTTALYLIFTVLNFSLVAMVYGLDGSNSHIQLESWYSQSPYNMTFLDFYLVILGVTFIGLIFMTVLTLFISSKVRSPFIGVILSALLLYLPSINLAETSDLADKILSLFPYNIMNVSGSFEIGVLYNLFGIILTQPTMMVITAFTGSAMLLPLTYRSFKNYQA